jgi:hypothetical protein
MNFQILYWYIFVSFKNQLWSFSVYLMICVPAQAPVLSDKKLLLLEGSPQQNRDLKPQYSNRVSSLNTGTKALLQSIGAWKHIANARYKTVKKLQVQEMHACKLYNTIFVLYSCCIVCVECVFTKLIIGSTRFTLRFPIIYHPPLILGFSAH